MANFLKPALLFMTCATNIQAKDLGNYGHVFPIAERSLLEMLYARLSQLTDEQLHEFNQKIQTHYVAVANEPPPVQGVEHAIAYRTHYFDPTIQVAQDIEDHLGRVIVAKGTCINPLATTPLETPLLVFDGSSTAHVQWAREQESTAQWILTKGKPLELEAQEQRPVYFDQFGTLCQKLAIQSVPARVFQEGLKLKIEEIPLEDTCSSS